MANIGDYPGLSSLGNWATSTHCKLVSPKIPNVIPLLYCLYSWFFCPNFQNSFLLNVVELFLYWQLKGFDVLFSSTDNRGFKQTNFPFSCASSCPSYLKSSYHEINMWSRPRSWPSSVASRPTGRPAGRPGSARSRRRGRWQRCFTLRIFKRYPEFKRRLLTGLQSIDSRLYFSHGTRTAREVVFNTFFFVFEIIFF